LELKLAVYKGAYVLDLEPLYVSLNELVHAFEMNYLRLNIWVCWVKISGILGGLS